jgi:hypothetical protein
LCGSGSRKDSQAFSKVFETLWRPLQASHLKLVTIDLTFISPQQALENAKRSRVGLEVSPGQLVVLNGIVDEVC